MISLTRDKDQDVYWRKLTPLECERLQTVPDDYTNSVSNTQRYKMLGNGWTIEVITHILKNMDV
jgi:site-specific DNA-cytosine methylase